MQTPVTGRNPAGGSAPKTRCCEGPTGYCREEGTRALPPRDRGKREVPGSSWQKSSCPCAPAPPQAALHCPPAARSQASCSRLALRCLNKTTRLRQWAVNTVTFRDRGIHSGPQLCPTRCALGRAHTLTSASLQQQGSPHREAHGKQAGPQMTEDLVRGTGMSEKLAAMQARKN